MSTQPARRKKKAPEKRYGKPGPLDDFWYQAISSVTANGVRVTPDTALNCVPVYACVKIITEALATLPLIIYRRLDPRGKERAPDHPLFKLFKYRPNVWQTPFEFVEMMTGHILLRGNAYAEIIRNNRNEPTDLVPLHPDRITPLLDAQGAFYEFWPLTGGKRIIDQRNMLHVKGFSSDGLVGMSPIELMADAVGMAKSAERYGSTVFNNSARPSGVLTIDGTLTEEAQERLKKSWTAAHSGQNAGRVAILEQGMSWQQVGVANTDLQYIQIRKLQAEDIAQAFGVPKHKLGLSDPSKNNVEQEEIRFHVDCLMPLARRWEQAIQRSLIGVREGLQYFVEFLVEGRLRGDTYTRYQSYAIGRQQGWLSVDEIREMENMNPLPDGAGEGYLVPLYMTQAGDEPGNNTGETKPEDIGKQPPDVKQKPTEIYDRSFVREYVRTELERALRREQKKRQRLAKLDAELAEAELVTYLQQAERYLVQALSPLATIDGELPQLVARGWYEGEERDAERLARDAVAWIEVRERGDANAAYAIRDPAA